MLRPLLAAAAAALVFAAPAAAADYDDAAYWSFADRSQQSQFDDRWDEKAGYYRMGGGGVEPMANSMLLLTHAVAAMNGHVGPARNDHRARILGIPLQLFAEEDALLDLAEMLAVIEVGESWHVEKITRPWDVTSVKLAPLVQFARGA